LTSAARDRTLRGGFLRRGLQLEYLTVGWNIVEGAVAITAAVVSGSVALLAFGVDSLIESTSGGVLIWRLRAEQHGDEDDEAAIELIERRAERLVGVSFFVLASYVAVEAVRSLVGRSEPEASPVGMVLLVVSIGVMVWLARAKRRTADALGSRALHADAAQTLACWRLSVIALVGIALNAALGWWWADPVAALGITALLALEGLEAWRGEGDG
jgi:divalent metal cation (Fe/Co/Zn/Cd) transporter